MSPIYHHIMEVQAMRMNKSRGRLFPKGGDDVAQPPVATHEPLSGPMTRARVKALHEKVNSLLYFCDFDDSMNGLLPQASVLCILRNEASEEPLESMGEDAEVGQDSSQEEEEKKGEKNQVQRYYRRDSRYYRCGRICTLERLPCLVILSLWI